MTQCQLGAHDGSHGECGPSWTLRSSDCQFEHAAVTVLESAAAAAAPMWVPATLQVSDMTASVATEEGFPYLLFAHFRELGLLTVQPREMMNNRKQRGLASHCGSC